MTVGDFPVSKIKEILKDTNTLIDSEFDTEIGNQEKRVYIHLCKILRRIIEYKQDGRELSREEKKQRINELYNEIWKEQDPEKKHQLRIEHSRLSKEVNQSDTLDIDSGLYRNQYGDIRTVDFPENEDGYIVRDKEGVIVLEGFDIDEFFASGSGNIVLKGERTRTDVYDNWCYYTDMSSQKEKFENGDKGIEKYKPSGSTKNNHERWDRFGYL